MAVPAHDQRDFEFATEFGLDIVEGVAQNEKLETTEKLTEAYTEPGWGVNSGEFDGLPTEQFKAKITAWLEKRGLGQKAVNYKLRDWVFSRQRYWGEPIPILHEVDSKGEPTGLTKAIGENELPVLLPELEDFKPTGRPGGPLEKATEWIQVRKEDGEYVRETNTMPQWAGSCWYYLRLLDPRNDERAWDPDLEKYWMPVDLYLGGAEHAVLHLLYARFWHKVLFDLVFVSTAEPFQKLRNQGMILGEVELTGYRTTNTEPCRPRTSFSMRLQLERISSLLNPAFFRSVFTSLFSPPNFVCSFACR